MDNETALRAAIAALLLLLGGAAWAQEPAGGSVRGVGADLRRASETWSRRLGPERQVVDQVCLVPDLPTFLQAIATWDERHYFPILIDDVELTFKFLRAFRPSRIVRFPHKPAKLEDDAVWAQAVTAVGQSWTVGTLEPDGNAAAGDTFPKGLGDTPAGLVFSSPDSPSLGGAVALAAGRFQPLVKLKVETHHHDVLSPAEARSFALEVEHGVAAVAARHDRLGDDCDFLTLAGDWPYRYQTDKGDNALDDLLGRFPEFDSRWAYAGRVTGDLTASVYRAMCSLFLQPHSALLFNTYSERGKPWSDYRMTDATDTLQTLLPVTHRAGERASLSGWHEAFDPLNRFGLVLINTHGNPSQFNLAGGPGQSADVPPSVPAAVLMIHSFSATDPNDPDTIAGRWLAQGAFVYFGSMNEPYLQAFRTPGVVASHTAGGMPLSAAARQSPPEAFGRPWRLMYLGDPLYRIDPRERPRLKTWGPVADWPPYIEYQEPGPDAPALTWQNWVLKTALFRLQAGVKPISNAELGAALARVERGQLPPKYRPQYDALLADALLASKRPGALLERLSAIPDTERSSQARRLWQTLVMNRIQVFVVRREYPLAGEIWSIAIGTPAPEDFHRQVTVRVAGLAESRRDLTDWRQRLRKAERTAPGAAQRIVAEELKRVEERLARPSTAR